MGKCKEFGCEITTKVGKSGKPYDYCWEHSDAKKKAELPPQTAQDKEKDIFTVFKDFMALTKEEYPKLELADGITIALALTNEYWKNDRTPR